MRKIILTLILFTSISITFHIQAQKGWSLGAKAGLNASSAGGDYSDARSRLGYNLGIIADYNFSTNIFFRTGLDFTSKGAKYEDNYGYPPKRHYRLNYFQLPVSIGYRLTVADNINLIANAGGYLAYGVYAREKYAVGTGWCGTPPITEFVIYTNKGFDSSGMYPFDCGVLGGVGFEYKQYMLLVNYELGLFNTMKSQDGGDPVWKNRNWTFSLGYKF